MTVDDLPVARPTHSNLDPKPPNPKSQVFKREGAHLTMDRDITLKDALCGFQISFTHMDKRQVVVSSAKGQITEPGSWMCVQGEGMPIKGNQFNKGNLFIRLSVKFPRTTQITPEAIKEISKLLPEQVIQQAPTPKPPEYPTC